MEERLQKYMASCGVASRRKCEEIILSGRVKVNGIIIKELGSKVDLEKDIVEVDGSVIKKEERKVYYMLNKPEGYITSVKDEKNRKTVLDIIKTEERIYPIGRLDYDSSGLIILTNDGDIYNKIIHPRVEIIKQYRVVVKGEFRQKDIAKFERGVDIGGYVTSNASLKILGSIDNRTSLEIGIHEGKNRQIRRMLSALGYEVISLKRVAIGKIRLMNLPKGEYRALTEGELKYLKSL
ncbi:MAG: pseudouridine synthase [Clostridium sp.]|nr:pseudouridine synthase [Clostridium sp.]